MEGPKQDPEPRFGTRLLALSEELGMTPEQLEEVMEALEEFTRERTARFPRRFPDRDNDDDPADGGL